MPVSGSAKLPFENSDRATYRSHRIQKRLCVETGKTENATSQIRTRGQKVGRRCYVATREFARSRSVS